MKCEPQSQYKQKAVIEFLTHEDIKRIEKANAGPINLFGEPHSGHTQMRRLVEVEQQIYEKIHQI